MTACLLSTKSNRKTFPQIAETEESLTSYEEDTARVEQFLALAEKYTDFSSCNVKYCSDECRYEGHIKGQGFAMQRTGRKNWQRRQLPLRLNISNKTINFEEAVCLISGQAAFSTQRRTHEFIRNRKKQRQPAGSGTGVWP